MEIGSIKVITGSMEARLNANKKHHKHGKHCYLAICEKQDNVSAPYEPIDKKFRVSKPTHSNFAKMNNGRQTGDVNAPRVKRRYIFIDYQ